MYVYIGIISKNFKKASRNSFMGKTEQIRFFEKIEIAMQNLCIVTIYGIFNVFYERAYFKE